MPADVELVYIVGRRMRARAERTSKVWKRAAAGLLALAAALAPRAALADDAQQFELAKGLFYAGQYEDAVKRLTILLDPSNPACASVEGAPTTPQTCHIADAVLIERSREMLVVALFALGRQADADAVIEKMLRANPAYSPLPGSVPQAVSERVREVKIRLQKELEDKARKDADEQRKDALNNQKAKDDERKWLEGVMKLASKETVIEKRSRVVAFVPFGVGQLQNGDTGWAVFFAASEIVTGAASIGLGVAHEYFASVNPSAKNPTTGAPVDKQGLTDLTRNFAIANQITFGAWAALAIAGVIQANVAFVPEARTTRDRPIPKRPEAPPLPTPRVAASPQGVTVGLVGVF
jgi:tetratricopeptide (TPR) repeat protein